MYSPIDRSWEMMSNRGYSREYKVQKSGQKLDRSVLAVDRLRSRSCSRQQLSLLARLIVCDSVGVVGIDRQD